MQKGNQSSIFVKNVVKLKNKKNKGKKEEVSI